MTIDSAPNTTIGGTVAAARNIISNNTNAGVQIINYEEPDGAMARSSREITSAPTSRAPEGAGTSEASTSRALPPA